MFDRGHFCLIICLKGNCEEKSKKQIYEDIVARFLSHLFPKDEKEAHHLMWNPIDRSPLFDPTLKEDCSICAFINKTFQNKKGDNDWFVLFSHNILNVDSFKSFFTPIFNNNQI